MRSDLWEVLERIRAVTSLEKRQWTDLLRLKEDRVRLLRSRQLPPPAHAVMNVAEYFNLSFDQIMAGQVDFTALARHCAGDSLYLPERYSIAPFSRRRTSINVLDYLETFCGWRAKARVLRYFQVKEALFSEPDQTINLRFLTDLCGLLAAEGHGEDGLVAMGAYSVVTNMNSALGRGLESLKRPRDIYESIFTDLAGKYYDRNFNYSIRMLNHEGCVLDVTSSVEVAAALDVKYLGSPNLCALRRGTFLSMPGYLGLTFSRIRESSCVHRGDSACTYVVDFGVAHRQSRERDRTFAKAGFPRARGVLVH